MMSEYISELYIDKYTIKKFLLSEFCIYFAICARISDHIYLRQVITWSTDIILKSSNKYNKFILDIERI